MSLKRPLLDRVSPHLIPADIHPAIVAQHVYGFLGQAFGGGAYVHNYLRAIGGGYKLNISFEELVAQQVFVGILCVVAVIESGGGYMWRHAEITAIWFICLLVHCSLGHWFIVEGFRLFL
jgi:hypothetical protein